MVGTSKILTVSYGTFSCTLEGFDDSFSTMKAIAEYFRGLAADDRYFGAEPPTPDAEMLAKIAEREISRRVDARMDDGGIVLRAAQLSDQSGDAEDAVTGKSDEDTRTSDVDAADAEAAEAKAAKKAEKAAKKAAKAKAKAEKKAKEKALAAEAKAAAEAASQAQSERNTQPDEVSERAAPADASEGEPVSEVEETRDTALSSVLAAEETAPENDSAAPAKAQSNEGDAEADAQEDGANDDTTASAATDLPAHPDADSVAAKLQRIRAVVGRAPDIAPSDDLTEQFLPQSAAGPDDEAPATDYNDNDAADHANDDSFEDTSDDTVDEYEDENDDSTSYLGTDMISRVMSRHAPEAEQADADEDTSDDMSDEARQTAEVAQPEQPRARVVRMKRADFEKSVAEKVDGSQDDSRDPDFGLLDGADDLDEYLEDSDFDDTGLDIAEDPGIDADLADNLHADEDEDATDAAATDLPDETADADAETDATAEDQPVEDGADATIAESDAENEEDDDTPSGNAFLTDEPHVDDAALERLMSETDAHMKEPEGSRRREAIAQLKAAVAAKEAARQFGERDDDDQDVENAFRNDLSEAVGPTTAPRPRPVVRGTTRTERPRPAPLKLVASQRVDLPEAEKRDSPVTPRRVSARQSDAADQSSGSFAEFADRMGATELPDLLEAAAAYTSFVEGAEEFSRPQILRRVRTVASDDFNREDGLRSFAKLLQDGRFTKVRNGRFQVADDSRFNPERRAG